MKTMYIRFGHKEDVYAIDTAYNLRPDEAAPPLICPACGDTLYVPIELPEDITISISMGDIHRPFPIEAPHLVIKGEPDLPTLTAFRSISPSEQQRLQQFPSMVFVDGNGFDMLVNGVSSQPVEHKCKSTKGE